MILQCIDAIGDQHLFRPKKKQKTIMDHDIYLLEERWKALENSWAGPFRKTVLPMIQEKPCRPFYCRDNGRPNAPVAILTGSCILKGLDNLTDQEVIGSLEFDQRWQYAFYINPFEAHICQNTSHNFRVLVSHNEQAHLALFIRIIERFLKRLKKQYLQLYQKLPQIYDQVYRRRSGYFADFKSSQVPTPGSPGSGYFASKVSPCSALIGFWVCGYAPCSTPISLLIR